MTRRAAVMGVVTAGAATAASAQGLTGVLQQLKEQAAKVQGQSQVHPAPPPPTIAPGKQGLVARGYSERFQPVRRMVAEGRYDEAVGSFKPLPKEASSSLPAGAAPIVNDPFLSNAEMGLLEFEGGRPEMAAADLKAAEDSLTTIASLTGAKNAGHQVANLTKMIAGKVTGHEGLDDYKPLDHETVLQLNYLALSHLLQGERSCYNVTRRCIDQQAELKAKFDKELETSRAKYQSDASKVSDSDRTSIDGLAGQIDAYDAAATRLPNAYVNPLGDYLAGMIQEIVSAEQPSLRDNSRISYENAVKLCGRSPQLSAAALAMARARVPAKERVLHVIVAEGFSPAREVLTYGLAIKGEVIPIRIPIFTPVPSAIDRIEVNVAGGPRLATLDPIGDFEAIRLRDQKDRVPQTLTSVVFSMLTSYMAAKQADRFGQIGQLAKNVREQNATPDTRSWLSLPRRFHVARVVLPPTAKAVEIFAYDPSGRRIGGHGAPLLADTAQSLVYARATDTGVQAQTARKLWIDGRLEEKA